MGPETAFGLSRLSDGPHYHPDLSHSDADPDLLHDEGQGIAGCLDEPLCTERASAGRPGLVRSGPPDRQLCSGQILGNLDRLVCLCGHIFGARAGVQHAACGAGGPVGTDPLCRSCGGYDSGGVCRVVPVGIHWGLLRTGVGVPDHSGVGWQSVSADALLRGQ